jgi:methylenetetrahydrofolate dehydrogenase (NADP+) / methenyltetrahydrofolate cyclohydrolase
MAEIIKGKRLAGKIREKTKARIDKLERPPGLAAILVGDDPASHLYVSLKEKAAKEVGIYFEKIEFEAGVSEGKILKEIKKLNERDDIQGILVQLPLPNQNEDKIINAIKLQKDVDGFHKKNRKCLKHGEPCLAPPVALAIMRLISATHQPLYEKNALIIANNEIFAEPLIELLKEQGVSGQFIKPDTEAIETRTRAADIIIVAIGRANFITKEMIKEGGIIIDVGTNKVDGKIAGDVSKEAKAAAGFASPVPGGVGPLTVAYLLMNVFKAANLQKSE